MDIEEMGKFEENFEYNEIATSLDFGFCSSNITSTSHPIIPSFSNIPPTTLSMNNATHPVAPPSFPPYSAAARWRSHFPATRNSGMAEIGVRVRGQFMKMFLKKAGEEEVEGSESESMGGGMREMIYRIAAMQPIEIDPEAVKAPKRRNVKISKDPQSVAARHRRERISERIRILQRIVPGGTKMDTASMLDEAIHYLKFLKNQLHSLQIAAASSSSSSAYAFPTVAHYNNKQQLIHFPQLPTHPHHHLDQDA